MKINSFILYKLWLKISGQFLNKFTSNIMYFNIFFYNNFKIKLKFNFWLKKKDNFDIIEGINGCIKYTL